MSMLSRQYALTYYEVICVHLICHYIFYLSCLPALGFGFGSFGLGGQSSSQTAAKTNPFGVAQEFSATTASRWCFLLFLRLFVVVVVVVVVFLIPIMRS